MTRRSSHLFTGRPTPMCIVAITGLFCAAAGGVSVATAEINWSIYRPTNTGILGDQNLTLYVDDQDRPWIAGYDPFRILGGMSRKNADGTWTALTNDVDAIYPQLSFPLFYDIAIAPSGVIWIGNVDGLLSYDPGIGDASFKRFDNTNSPLPYGTVYDVAVAPDGTIWCAVHDISTVFGGLAQYNPATNAWNVWDSNMPWASACGMCTAVDNLEIQTDLAGGGYTVWFDGDGGGFGYMGMASYHNGSFTWYGMPSSLPQNAPITPTGLFSNRSISPQNELLMTTNLGFAKRSPTGSYSLLPPPPISSIDFSVIVPLNNGRMAAGSYTGDLFVFEDGVWQFKGNWNGNHTYSIDEESNGALWICGLGGAARYANGQFQRYRVTNTGPVGFFQDAVAFGADGSVYLDGNAGPGYGGFEIFNGTTWTCVNDYNYGLGPAWGQASDDVAGLCSRANGHLAIAPNGIQGVLDWDGSNYTVLIPNGFAVNYVTEDTLGRLWAAPYDENTLHRVISPGQWVTYSSGNSPLYPGNIVGVVPDPKAPGFVWTATLFGLVHTDGQKWNLYPSDLLGLNPSSSINCLDRAPDGTLWVGSGQGLFHFNPATSGFVRYTTANSGLISDQIHKVHVAPDSSVWVANQSLIYPYPGGLSHLKGSDWTTYTTANSPLRHPQNGFLDSRPVEGGYELWVGMMSEGVARLFVPIPPIPGDLDGDGDVDAADREIFISVLIGHDSDPQHVLRADLSHDNVADGEDVRLFITAFLQ